MDKRIVQVNIRTSAETAERLKAVADQGGITLGALIEKMLASYQPDSSVIASGDDWRDALAKLANEFQTAVMALESRLVALEAANIGKVAPRRKVAKIGLESAVEPSSSIPPKVLEDAAQSEKGESDTRDAIDTLVHQHIGIEQLSIQATMKAIRAAGLPVSQGRIAESMKRLGLEPVGGLRQRK